LLAKDESFQLVILGRDAFSILGKGEDVLQGLPVGVITNHPRRKHIANLIEPEFKGCTRHKSSNLLPNDPPIGCCILHMQFYSKSTAFGYFICGLDLAQRARPS
jgi:hypothetical protein